MTSIPAPTSPELAFDSANPLENLLAWMIAQDTSSFSDPSLAQPTIPMLKAIAQAFEAIGAHAAVYTSDDGPFTDHGALVIRVGPKGPGGIALSGHVDVIPAKPQDWRTAPFELTLSDNGDTYAGRGVVDMKGPDVNALLTAYQLQLEYNRNPTILQHPVHVVLSSDEEIGCRGTDTAVAALKAEGADPELILVLEPTDGRLVQAHKGGMSLSINLKGPNVLRDTLEMQRFLKELQEELAGYYRNESFTVPFSVINLGTVDVDPQRGTATLGVHMRPIAEMPVEAVTARIEAKLAEIQQRDLETAKAETAAGDVTVCIKLQGISAHSSNAAFGVNCFEHAIAFFARIQEEIQGIEMLAVKAGTSRNTIIGSTELTVTMRASDRDALQEILQQTEAEMREEGGRKGLDCSKISVGITESAVTRQAFAPAEVEASLDVLSHTLPLAPMPQERQGSFERLQQAHAACYGAGAQDSAFVDFATEAGGLQRGFPNALVIVSHPGDLFRDGAHAPNEHVEREHLLKGLQFVMGATFAICGDPKALEGKPSNIVMVTDAPELMRQMETLGR